MVKVGGVCVQTHWLIVGCRIKGVVCHLNAHTSVSVIDRFLASPPADYCYYDNH